MPHSSDCWIRHMCTRSFKPILGQVHRLTLLPQDNHASTNHTHSQMSFTAKKPKGDQLRLQRTWCGSTDPAQFETLWRTLSFSRPPHINNYQYSFTKTTPLNLCVSICHLTPTPWTQSLGASINAPWSMRLRTSVNTCNCCMQGLITPCVVQCLWSEKPIGRTGQATKVNTESNQLDLCHLTMWCLSSSMH